MPIIRVQDMYSDKYRVWFLSQEDSKVLSSLKDFGQVKL